MLAADIQFKEVCQFPTEENVQCDHISEQLFVGREPSRLFQFRMDMDSAAPSTLTTYPYKFSSSFKRINHTVYEDFIYTRTSKTRAPLVVGQDEDVLRVNNVWSLYTRQRCYRRFRIWTQPYDPDYDVCLETSRSITSEIECTTDSFSSCALDGRTSNGQDVTVFLTDITTQIKLHPSLLNGSSLFEIHVDNILVARVNTNQLDEFDGRRASAVVFDESLSPMSVRVPVGRADLPLVVVWNNETIRVGHAWAETQTDVWSVSLLCLFLILYMTQLLIQGTPRLDTVVIFVMVTTDVLLVNIPSGSIEEYLFRATQVYSQHIELMVSALTYMCILFGTSLYVADVVFDSRHKEHIVPATALFLPVVSYAILVNRHEHILRVTGAVIGGVTMYIVYREAIRRPIWKRRRYRWISTSLVWSTVITVVLFNAVTLIGPIFTDLPVLVYMWPLLSAVVCAIILTLSYVFT